MQFCIDINIPKMLFVNLVLIQYGCLTLPDAPMVLVPTVSTGGGGGVRGEKNSNHNISRTNNATNLKPLEVLGVSFKVSKSFKLI